MTFREYAEETFWVLYSEPYRYGVIAVVVLLVLLVVLRRWRKARKPISLYHSQGGTVEIARQTLRGLIVGAARRVEGVEAATCKYDQRGRKLRIKVALHLAAEARLRAVEDELKQSIRNALHVHVGYDPNDVEPIDLRVIRIIGEPAPGAKLPPTDDEPRPAPEETAEDASAEEEPSSPRA